MLASGLGHLTRLRVIGFEHVLAAQRQQGGAALVTWHGRILLPVFVLRGKPICAIASLSRDGELLHRVYSRFGGVSVRGSTNRQALQALRGATRMLRDGYLLTMTPDGPKGPAGQVQGGILLMAQKAGTPIIPVGAAAQPAWYLHTWDRFLVPYPLARATVTFGEPLFIPPQADGAQLDHLAHVLEQRINAMIAQAEAFCRDSA